jgi:translocation and assembly module TamB
MRDVAAHGDEVPRDEDRTAVVVRRRVNWPVRIAKWLLGVVIGLVVLAGLAIVAINTDPGRRFAARQIEGLEFANGMKVGVGRIEGSLYGAMTIHDFTLSDPRGVFLASPLVRLDWRPFDYLNNHVDIRSLHAPTATLRRLPQFRATPPSDGPLLPDLDIDIGRLEVDRLILEAPVTGERRVGSLDGRARIADRRAQVALQAAVIGGEGRTGGDRLALQLNAVPEDNRLALKAFLSAPANGVVAKLAGLTAPLRVQVSGNGDWRRWDGRLLADLDNAAFARLQLSARNGTFGVRGPTRVARLVEGPTAALLGPITTVALQSTWADRRADLNGRVGSDAFTLAANGGADFGRNRLDDLRLNFALLKPGALAPNLAGRDVRALVTLDGELRRPTIDYRLTATALAFNDMALRGLSARGVARFTRDHIAVPVAATARAITGLDTVAGGTITNVRLDGDLAVDWPRILSDNLRIRSDRIDAKAFVLADVASGLYAGAIEGRVND